MESEAQYEQAVVGGMEGQVVAGKYQLVRLLGQGGMGAVYEGRNLATLKRCAVKLLLSHELSKNEQMVKRFFREARASSIIESDHIVQIFDSGSDPALGYPYMVMEMLQGEDLEGTLKRLNAVYPLVAAKLVLQAAIGLAKAHEKGIVHRDIKPANLYVTSRDAGDLVVKLLDFGIAKVKMENFAETSQGLTRTGSMLGTPLYMSPEQARGASNIDARSDVWSLGVVLYELLSGRLPYEDASSLGELMVSIITSDIPLLQDKAPWVPPELAEVTHRAMSRDLEKRFQHAGELRDALAALLPDGPRVTPDMMVPVAQDQRAMIAPRLQLTDGMLRATTRTGLTMTRGGSPAKKSSTPVVIALLAGLLIAGGGGVAAYLMVKKQAAAERDAREQAAPVLLSAAVPEPVAAPAILKKFPLAVGPQQIQVFVDGVKQDVVDGKIDLIGSPGATRKITLKLEQAEKEHLVAITDTGLVPDRLEMEPAKAPPVPRGGARPAAKPGKAPATPGPVAPASKPGDKPAPKIDNSVSEFG